MLVKHKFSLTFYINITVGLVFFISAVFMIIIINQKMKQRVLLEAEDKARLILDHNLATHTYFSHQLKPSVFELTDGYRPGNYFNPAWMSSTYAVREIDNYFKKLETVNANYYYKECAINARSPLNEADSYEKKFINELNIKPDLVQQTDVRILDNKKYFVVLRRGEMMEKSCLRCHDTALKAPAELVKRYGPDRSFSRKEGETVSAVSIRIPVDIPFAEAGRVTWQLSGGMLIILLVVFVCHYMINKLAVTNPIEKIRRKAELISESEIRVGEEVDHGFSRELDGLAHSFNRMSKRLRDHINSIEDVIKKRTSELSKTNEDLNREIDLRRKSESEKEKLIENLETALHEIKTLRGILPICSYCKRIQNDEGKWEQVGDYIHKHSEADMSHGICPECMKERFPELTEGKDNDPHRKNPAEN